jgi:hypothetical protein
MAAHAVVDAGRRPAESGRDRISLTGITAYGHHGVTISGPRAGLHRRCELHPGSHIAASADDLGQTVDLELWRGRSLPTWNRTR